MKRYENLIRIYPKTWRERYGEEYIAMLEQTELTPRNIINILTAGLMARINVYRSGIYGLASFVAGFISFQAVVAYAVHTGITDNILWAPSTPMRAIVLLIALTPLCAGLSGLIILIRKQRRVA